MDPQKTIHIKEEETDCAPDERGLMSYGTLAMDHEQATYIKKEGTDCAPDEPGLMFPEDPLKLDVPGLPIKPDPELKWHVVTSENNSYGTLATDHQQTTYIKEEETDRAPDEPGLMFPEYPLKLDVPGLPIKPDPELKLHVATSETDSYGTLAMNHQQTTYIKDEETDCALDDQGSMFPEDPLKPEVPGLHIKLDPELKLHDATSENNSVEYSLDTSWTTDFIKDEPPLNLEAEDTANIVVAPRTYASNSTGLLQSNESNELNIGTENSPNFIMFRKGEEEDKEESLSAPRLTCSLRENKCQTFICSVCQQSFTSKYGLMMHVFVHIDGVEQPKSVCKSCGEVFPSSVSLKKHLKISEAEQDSFADKEETFDCSGKSFTQLGTHKDLELIHTETQSHKCDICSKSFTKLSTLKGHTLIHTGTRPHSCDICGKSFTRLSHLKGHALIHTGTKPHSCDICGKFFTRSSNLKRHALVHTGITGIRPHKCVICGKSFTQLSDLKNHALIHTGIRRHKCDICGKSFTHLSYLKKHALIHTGIKPHKCVLCGRSFTRLGTLKIHALIHTRTLHK